MSIHPLNRQKFKDKNLYERQFEVYSILFPLSDGNILMQHTLYSDIWTGTLGGPLNGLISEISRCPILKIKRV